MNEHRQLPALARMPWQVSAVLAGAFFFGLKWGFPLAVKGNKMGEAIAPVAQKIAVVALAFFTMTAIVSAILAQVRKQALAKERAAEAER